MFRLTVLALFITIGSTAYSQVSASHEPTSATDSEVKLHTSRKSRFFKSSRERKSERITEPARESKYKREIRGTERHGKPLNSTYRSEVRETERHGGSGKKTRRSEARQTESQGKVKESGSRVSARGTERNGKPVKKSRAGKRIKVKRAVGRSNF